MAKAQDPVCAKATGITVRTTLAAVRHWAGASAAVNSRPDRTSSTGDAKGEMAASLDVEALEEVRQRREREQHEGDPVGNAAMAGDPAAEQDERDAEQRRGSHREVRHLGCEGVADDVRRRRNSGVRADAMLTTPAADGETERRNRRRTGVGRRTQPASPSRVESLALASPAFRGPPPAAASLRHPEPGCEAMRGR